VITCRAREHHGGARLRADKEPVHRSMVERGGNQVAPVGTGWGIWVSRIHSGSVHIPNRRETTVWRTFDATSDT
jgi:hypothetical protein